MDNVGMHDVRKGCEAHLVDCLVQLVEDFDLFSHWDEVDEGLKRVSL